MNHQEPHRFILYLQKLADGQGRGALASLRRGLGQPPGTVADMYRYVEPFLGQDARYKESAYYLVAALFAFHPKSTDEGNMGAHLAKTRTESGEDALERRFTALLAAHPDDLPEYLRQAVSFLRSPKTKNLSTGMNFFGACKTGDAKTALSRKNGLVPSGVDAK